MIDDCMTAGRNVPCGHDMRGETRTCERVMLLRPLSRQFRSFRILGAIVDRRVHLGMLVQQKFPENYPGVFARRRTRTT